MKHMLMGFLETLEYLARDSTFKPKRSIYLALGHDEEIGGMEGAKHIAAYLKDHVQKKSISPMFEFMWDEGLFIIENALSNLQTPPIAFICCSEKGSINVKLEVNVNPGHSSSPPSETAIGILSKAIVKLECK